MWGRRRVAGKEGLYAPTRPTPVHTFDEMHCFRPGSGRFSCTPFPLGEIRSQQGYPGHGKRVTAALSQEVVEVIFHGLL